MTKEDIKKALKICAYDCYSCDDCPYDDVINCGNTLKNDVRELIAEQEREIERLKAENDANMQYIRMMGIQSHIKTLNEQVNQAKIDILNHLKEKCKFDGHTVGVYKNDIDELIEEVQNETRQMQRASRA